MNAGVFDRDELREMARRPDRRIRALAADRLKDYVHTSRDVSVLACAIELTILTCACAFEIRPELVQQLDDAIEVFKKAYPGEWEKVMRE